MPVTLGVFSRERLLVAEFRMFVRDDNGRAGIGAACALAVICALIPAAGAGQNSGSSATAKKPTASKTTLHKKTSSASASKAPARVHTSGKASSRKKKSSRVRGQQKIDSERAQAIQAALIREHYLSGEPTGTWNDASEAAMRRYQEDNGWQNKEVPDSRALIKLGLGPSKDHLLNPESAMTTVPDPPKAEPLPTSTNSSAPTASPVPADPNSGNSSPR